MVGSKVPLNFIDIKLYHSRNIPEIVHITSVQDSRKFVNSVKVGGKEQNLSVSMKCSTGTEISVAFVGFEGRCHVFDLKCHPALMQEGGLRELFEDKEVTKVRTNDGSQQKRNNYYECSLYCRYVTYSVFISTSLKPNLK